VHIWSQHPNSSLVKLTVDSRLKVEIIVSEVCGCADRAIRDIKRLLVCKKPLDELPPCMIGEPRKLVNIAYHSISEPTPSLPWATKQCCGAELCASEFSSAGSTLSMWRWPETIMLQWMRPSVDVDMWIFHLSDLCHVSYTSLLQPQRPCI
jgi:hypothetical protein